MRMKMEYSRKIARNVRICRDKQYAQRIEWWKWFPTKFSPRFFWIVAKVLIGDRFEEKQMLLDIIVCSLPLRRPQNACKNQTSKRIIQNNEFHLAMRSILNTSYLAHFDFNAFISRYYDMITLPSYSKEFTHIFTFLASIYPYFWLKTMIPENKTLNMPTKWKGSGRKKHIDFSVLFSLTPQFRIRTLKIMIILFHRIYILCKIVVMNTTVAGNIYRLLLQ